MRPAAFSFAMWWEIVGCPRSEGGSEVADADRSGRLPKACDHAERVGRQTPSAGRLLPRPRPDRSARGPRNTGLAAGRPRAIEGTSPARGDSKASGWGTAGVPLAGPALVDLAMGAWAVDR